VVKTKNPTAGLAVGFKKSRMQSEPNRRASQPQRVKQQVQIQITIHREKVTITPACVKCFFADKMVPGAS
jgi:hypothetical protein